MNTVDEFKSRGFTLVRKFIDKETTDKLYDYTLKNKKNGILNDQQIPNTPSFYKDNEMNYLQDKMHKNIEELVGIPLFKTYNYYRTYKRDDILKIHKDRPACEISVTLNLGYKGNPWPIWITDFDEIPNEVIMEPGDALLYRGCDLNHWRVKNIFCDDCSQVFLHFVNQNGPFKWAKDDLIH